MKPSRLVALAGVVAFVAVGALLPAAGCAGTGTTPMCDYPDGANNPESGCGELVEASAGDVSTDGSEDAAPAADSHAPIVDASDASLPVDASDAGHKDGGDAGEAGTDGAVSDAKSDAPG